MYEVVIGKPQDPINEMRDLIRNIHQSGYSNVIDMQQFITLYNEFSPKDDTGDFFERLDAPDIGLEFWDGTFDDVVLAYDNLGGSRVALGFPETGRVASSDWTKELCDLEAIFNSPEIVHVQSHALYVRVNAQALIESEAEDTRFTTMLANPKFLTGLVQVYDYESNYQNTEHLPSSWPNKDDGFLQTVLQAVNYKYADSFRKDWQYKRNGHTRDGLVANLKAVASLETARLGATKFLSEQFGIRHFSRYPTELLVSQFDNKGRVSRPYGVSISAVDDHNGAFSDHWIPNDSIPSGLYAQAKESHDFVVAETETVTEFEERLKFFDALNGEQFKIDFALIESHGTPDSIHFGYIPNLGSLALRSKLSDVRDIFSPRASIAMTGCSTGQINGIAQSVSHQFNTVVVAPSAVASTESIKFISGLDRIRLLPVYGKRQDGTTTLSVVYKNGSPFGSKKTADYLFQQ